MQSFSFQTVPHIVLEAGLARRLGELLRESATPAAAPACSPTPSCIAAARSRRRWTAWRGPAGRCW